MTEFPSPIDSSEDENSSASKIEAEKTEAEKIDVELEADSATNRAENSATDSSADPHAESAVTLSDVVVDAAEPLRERASQLASSLSALGRDEAGWDMSTKRMVLVILLIAMVFIIWISRSVIPILIFSGIIAYLLKPIVDLGERIRIPRSVSTIFVFLLLVVAAIIVPVILAPILIEQLVLLINFDRAELAGNLEDWLVQNMANLPREDIVIPLIGDRTFTIPIGDVAQQAEKSIQSWFPPEGGAAATIPQGDGASQPSFLIPTIGDILNYFQTAVGTATNVVGSATAISFRVFGGIVQVLISTILILVTSLYLTKDAPIIRTYIEELFPRSYQPELIGLFKRIGNIWQAFFRGQITLCLIIGTITTVVLYLLGMPGALVLGIFAGFTEIIPNLGPALALIPAVIVALIQGSTNPALMEIGNLGNVGFALIIFGVYFVIQQVENSVIVPRVIGDSVNLHPVIIICGVYIGFGVGGILGAFLAAPVIATVRTVGSYIHAKLLDYEPFVNEETANSTRRETTIYRRTVTGDELAARDRSASQLHAPSDDEEASSLLDEGTVAS